MTAVAFFERFRQRQLHIGTLGRTDFFDEVVVIVGRFAVVLGFEQQIGAHAALGDIAGDSELAQFRSRRIRLNTVGKVEVNVAEGACGLLIHARCFVGAANGEFHIAAHRSAVFFEQSRCLLRAAFHEQRIRIDEVGIADQQGVGKVLAEIGKRGERFGIARGFQVGVAQVVGNVVSEFAGAGFGAVERVDSFGIVVIERAGIADDEPGQCSGIFFGVTARIGFDAGIGDGSAVLQQLLRHGTKTGGGDKGPPHPAHARRDGFTLFPGAGFLSAGGSGGFLFVGCALRWRALRWGALRWRALSWRRGLGLGDCGRPKAEPEEEESSSENYDCKTAHSNPTYCRKLAPMMERSSSARLRIISC